MGHYDEFGNWIEEFRSIPYNTMEDAREKIDSVIKFHVYDAGWVLNGEAHVERDHNGQYVAVIPLKKSAEKNNNRSSFYR